MKRYSFVIALAIFMVIAGSVNAFGSWFITYPDTTVDPGATLEYKVAGAWEEIIVAITVPTVVRSIDPGAFWAGNLPYDTNGNAASHPYAYNVDWHWTVSWAFLVLEMRPGIPDGCGTTSDVGYDGVSPDHFVLNATGVGSGEPATPDGMDFVTLTFDVGMTEGQFEFDTACFTEALGTIFMTDIIFPPVEHGPTGTNDVVFNKGTITIGEGVYVEDITAGTGVPGQYELLQNYPNPFNANTLIEFSIRQPGWVKLEIFNILGQTVAAPVDEFVTAGVKRTYWDGKDLNGTEVSSGMYFYRLTAGDFVEMKKMVFMK